MTTFTHQVIGPLQPFHAAGILGLADVQVAAALMRIGGHHLAGGTTADAMVALGAALCVRALRAGSVCIDLTAEPGTWAPEDESVDPTGAPPAGEGAGGIWLDWPDPVEWVAAAQAHPLVAHGAQAPDDRPLRLTGSLLYLQRYWRDEQAIDTDRQQRARGVQVDHAELVDGLGRLFPEKGANRQRLAAATAALRAATIVAGGPGTGKTTTVARIIALLRQLEGAELSVALAAPTGKAAARLREEFGPQQTCRSTGYSGGLPLLRRLHRRARRATHVSYRTLHVVRSDASGGGTPRRRTRNLSACRRRAPRQRGKHVDRGRASGSVVSAPRKHGLVHAGCRRGRRVIPRV